MSIIFNILRKPTWTRKLGTVFGPVAVHSAVHAQGFVGVIEALVHELLNIIK